MMRLAILSILPFLWLAPPARAQASASMCAVFTDVEVTALLGEIKQTQPMGQGACNWSGNQRMFTVVRLDDQSPETVTGMVNALKSRVRAPETAQDEPGIGDRAVSTVEKGGGRLTLMASRGTTVWSFSLEHVYSNTSLEEQMPKLRELARDAVNP
jgi:hypothetical protein